MKEMYYPCVMHNNELHVLTSSGRYYTFSTNEKWIGWKRYERAKQEVMKSRNLYKVLVLSTSEIKELFDKVYENDDIYFEVDKRNAAYELVKGKFLN